MTIHRKLVPLQSRGLIPTFHDVTREVREAVKESGVVNGTVTIYSQHTTCNVMIQEASHDTNYFGTEYLHQDIIDIMEKLIPTCRSEGQYMHPGPKHIEFAMGLGTEEGPWTSLNVDAHLRSSFMARSETIIIADGQVQLGDFGYVYFVDWDQVRARKRTCQIQVMGNRE